MLKKILPMVLMGFAAWQWDTRRRERNRLQQSSTPKSKPKDVTTWEGEGGALPVTGSHMGPTPELPNEATTTR